MRGIAMKRIILAILIITTALFFVACSGPREVLTAQEFTSRMEGAGHTVEDFTHEFDDAPPGVDVRTFLVADTGGFDVDFFVFETDQAARAFHNVIRRELEDSRGRTSSHREVNLANFNRLTQTTDGRFEALVRVENTAILIATTTQNRADAQAVLDLLGY